MLKGKVTYMFIPAAKVGQWRWTCFWKLRKVQVFPHNNSNSSMGIHTSTDTWLPQNILCQDNECFCVQMGVGVTLSLCSAPEAPVVYDANNFSRNHIKRAHGSIDCMNDIILFPSQSFLTLMGGVNRSSAWRDPLSRGKMCRCSFSPALHFLAHANTFRGPWYPLGGGSFSSAEVSTLDCWRQAMRQLH